MEVTRRELRQGKITKEVNEIIIKHSEPILVQYANWYKEDARGFLNAYLNNLSVKMICCLLIFTCKKNGLLKELEGKKDFSEWVEKQTLEDKWKPVLEKFLLIIWGINS
jgi:hypothetical protein